MGLIILIGFIGLVLSGQIFKMGKLEVEYFLSQIALWAVN